MQLELANSFIPTTQIAKLYLKDDYCRYQKVHNATYL